LTTNEILHKLLIQKLNVMNKILLSLLGLLLWSSVWSQATQSFNYQAVISDSDDNLLTNQQVDLTFSIIQENASDTAIYSETHELTTNSQGMVTANIGTGNPEDFAAIDWNDGPYFIKIKMDDNVMGTSQLLSVPFALYAQKSASSEVLEQEMDSLSDALKMKLDQLEELQMQQEEKYDSLNAVLLSKANTHWTNEYSGFYIDERDGQKYSFITIGEQVWMTENMNIGDTLESSVQPAWNDTIEKYAYANNVNNLAEYGGLYTWREMMQLPDSCDLGNCSELIKSRHQGICPEGWHIPSMEEWQKLIDFLGGNSAGAGGKLKETGTIHWSSPNAGATNSSNFTALPGGKLEEGLYNYFGLIAYFGCAAEADLQNTYTYRLYYDSDDILRVNTAKRSAFSVRCIKD